MEYLIICIVAFTVSGLTLFSGFGLGTVLVPVFAIFFPIDLSIAMTAIVHFLNNLLKLTLLGKHADKTAVVKFGAPAIIASFLGAWLLVRLSDLQPLLEYNLFSIAARVTPVKLIVAVLMIFFALIEIVPRFEKASFEKKYLPFGGVLSGFFGGLSGHQGALRSAFLVRSGLSKESFIATGVVIACMVDISRISVYSSHFSQAGIGTNKFLLFAVIASAFLGTFIGKRLMKNITLRAIQITISIMLFGIAVCLGAGII